MSTQTDTIKTDYEYEIEIQDNITIVKIPEKYVDKPLTELQKKTLLLLEEEFSCRYTDEDEDYVATVKLGSITPPLISSYRPGWNNKRNDRNRSENKNWEDSRSYSNNRNSNYFNNRPRYDYKR